jgi:hypothetical protein
MREPAFTDYPLFAPLFSRSETNRDIVLMTWRIVPGIAVQLCKKVLGIDMVLFEDSIEHQILYDDTVVSFRGRVEDIPANVLVMCRVDDNTGIDHRDMLHLYNSVVEQRPGEHVYFILISRFFKHSIVVEDQPLLQPRSISEFLLFEQAVAYPEKVAHIDWLDWFNITTGKRSDIPEEIQHMLYLQKEWMKAKNRKYFIEYAFSPNQKQDSQLPVDSK